jgi:hypothetical protein
MSFRQSIANRLRSRELFACRSRVSVLLCLPELEIDHDAETPSNLDLPSIHASKSRETNARLAQTRHVNTVPCKLNRLIETKGQIGGGSLCRSGRSTPFWPMDIPAWTIRVLLGWLSEDRHAIQVWGCWRRVKSLCVVSLGRAVDAHQTHHHELKTIKRRDSAEKRPQNCLTTAPGSDDDNEAASDTRNAK